MARPVGWVRARLAAGDELPFWFVFEPWLAPLLDDVVDPAAVPIDVESKPLLVVERIDRSPERISVHLRLRVTPPRARSA